MSIGEVIGNLIKFSITILFAGIVFLLVCYRSETKCESTKIIKIVGGCNRWAECAVSYTDGTFGQQNWPVPGQKVCAAMVTRFYPRFWKE